MESALNARELAQILMNIPAVGGETVKNILSAYRGEPLSILLPFSDRILSVARRKADEQNRRAREKGIAISCYTENSYPSRLLSIRDYPPLIYSLGNRSILEMKKSIALVGSRLSTKSVLSETYRVGSLLSNEGYLIVSGLALGCDSRAHCSAIDSQKHTVAVMPCAVDILYPRENRFIYDQIKDDQGAIISEYAPGTTPAPFRFVRRDRLQSGLADMVVLMDSPLRGGTMHTVKAALEQGRMVYAYDSSAQGNRFLINKGLAIPFVSPEDLLEKIEGNCLRERDQLLFSYD